MDAVINQSSTQSSTRFGTQSFKQRNWLITGATGFIGRELVHYLLKHTEDHLTLLVRASTKAGASLQRVLDQQQTIDASAVINASRLSVVECDFSKPKLGLVKADFDALQRYNNYFVHLAANTRFSETLEVARSVNVKGTESAVDIAHDLHQHGSLARFAYISTAYVHGCRTGLVRVGDPLQPESARNTYERSKSEAELFIRSLGDQLPHVIFRPSIVVGDSVTGRSSGSSTMYWAIKQYLRGRRRFFGDTGARLDIVPVDFVVLAMFQLMLQPGVNGQCFPLVAGVSGDISLGHLSKSVNRFFDLPAPVLMSPRLVALSSGLISKVSALLGQKVFVDNMLSYLPYFSKNPQFDNSNTLAALASINTNGQSLLPEFDTYCDALFRHCLTMGWDKSRGWDKNRKKAKSGNNLGLDRVTG